MKFKLETNIPLTNIKRHGTTSRSQAFREAIAKMKPNQSFAFTSLNRNLSDLYNAAAEVGKKVTTRKIGTNRYRVWLGASAKAAATRAGAKA